MLKQLFAVLVIASSVLAHADVINPVCMQTGDNTYAISFALTGDSHRVTITASGDPTGKTGLVTVLQTEKTEVTVTAGQPGQRMYFFLEPDHGRAREVSIRHLALQGAPNFRDLGGYKTTDGRFVRWGLLYRSGVLSNLTASDFAYLRQLDVHVVCDFRTAEENKVAPEIWVPGSDVLRVSAPIGTAGSKDVNAPMQQFLSSNPNAEQTKAWLAKVYGDFALTDASEYAKVFAQLKQDHLPLLYHCTAGKDRTGVFSALLLLTLGVPEKTVLADYQLTDKYMLNAMSPEQSRKMLANAGPAYAKASPEVSRAMMSADPEFLRATLLKIDEKFGSFDNYRRTELGVSDADVEILKARLLEK